MINWDNIIPVLKERNTPLSFSQFKRKRQKENPRKVGKPTEKGYLSHEKAYQEYLKSFNP